VSVLLQLHATRRLRFNCDLHWELGSAAWWVHQRICDQKVTGSTHTVASLSPTSVIRYRLMTGDSLRLGR